MHPSRPDTENRNAPEGWILLRVITALAVLLLALVLSALFHAAPAAAQADRQDLRCTEVAPGDDIRFDYGSARVEGTIVTTGRDRLRVRVRGVEQTLDRRSSLVDAEVRCRLAEARGPGLLNSALIGGLVGGVAGFIVGQVAKDPAPAAQESCVTGYVTSGLGSLGGGQWRTRCRTIESPAPSQSINEGSGFVVGFAAGMLWGYLRKVTRDWVPLAEVDGGPGASALVQPTPGQPGTWSVGLRVPVGSGR